MKYFIFRINELCCLVTWHTTPNCWYIFQSKFTRSCRYNDWL